MSKFENSPKATESLRERVEELFRTGLVIAIQDDSIRRTTIDTITSFIESECSLPVAVAIEKDAHGTDHCPLCGENEPHNHDEWLHRTLARERSKGVS